MIPASSGCKWDIVSTGKTTTFTFDNERCWGAPRISRLVNYNRWLPLPTAFTKKEVMNLSFAFYHPYILSLLLPRICQEGLCKNTHFHHCSTHPLADSRWLESSVFPFILLWFPLAHHPCTSSTNGQLFEVVSFFRAFNPANGCFKLCFRINGLCNSQGLLLHMWSRIWNISLSTCS